MTQPFDPPLAIDAYLDGELDADQEAALRAWLAEDPQRGAQMLAERTLLHSRLALMHAQADPTDTAAPVGRGTLLHSALQFFTRPTPLSISVAATVIGLLITAMAFIAAPIYRQLAGGGREPGEPAPPIVVAQLTGMQDAIWGEGQIGAQLGAFLPVGHRLDMQRGLAEVTFNKGAVVVLEGPLRARIDAAGLLALEQGKLLAHVPPAAVGFKVTTPLMEVVDLGTDFGVVVQPGNSSEIHVLQGNVEVSQIVGTSAVAPVILGTGQAWKFDAAGGRGQLLASEPQRFDLAFAKPQVAILQAGRPEPNTGEIYDGVDDVMIMQWAPNWNFGAREEFDVGHFGGQAAHGLLRFDLSPLKGKVERLLAVTLRITPNRDAAYFPWRGAGQIEVHRVSQSNAHWQEGTFFGGTNPGAGEGDATWNRLRHPAQVWAGSPGASSAGLDYEAAPLASASYTPQTMRPLDFHLGDLSLVQAWIEGETSGGVLLRETTGARDNRINFHSSESGESAARPQLIIAYVPASDETSHVEDDATSLPGQP